eukprot:NODE_49_length_31687_cov_0.791123.p13 type:complete len:212 gc:universal NODE_49_length_31687_cov_0.791123:19355-18720(-)
MEKLDKILKRVETKPQKQCRLSKAILYVQYNIEKSDNCYLSFQSGVLNIFAGPPFSGKFSFAKFLISSSYFEEFSVNNVIISPFSKYVELKKHLESLYQHGSINSADFVYEDIGKIPKLRKNCVHIIHHVCQPCRYEQKQEENQNYETLSYLYYFDKMENDLNSSIVSIRIIKYYSRTSLINDLQSRKISGTQVGRLKFTIGKSVKVEPWL